MRIQDHTPTKHIEKSIVVLDEKGGHGILTEGGIILTAAHCVEHDLKRIQDLQENINVEIRTIYGLNKCMLKAMEPVADIAILGRPDDQEYPTEAELYDKFCENALSISISRDEYEPFEKFKVSIYNHEKKWIKGEAMITKDGSPKLLIETKELILPGASGGPILNNHNELVGIVSMGNIEDDYSSKSTFSASIPYLSMPVWLYRKLSE